MKKNIIKLRLLSFLFTLVLFPSLLYAGYVSVSENIYVGPNPVVLGNSYMVSIALKETQGSAITFDSIAVAILAPDGRHLYDLATYPNVTIGAYSTWRMMPRGTICVFQSIPDTHSI